MPHHHLAASEQGPTRWQEEHEGVREQLAIASPSRSASVAGQGRAGQGKACRDHTSRAAVVRLPPVTRSHCISEEAPALLCMTRGRKGSLPGGLGCGDAPWPSFAVPYESSMILGGYLLDSSVCSSLRSWWSVLCRRLPWLLGRGNGTSHQWNQMPLAGFELWGNGEGSDILVRLRQPRWRWPLLAPPLDRGGQRTNSSTRPDTGASRQVRHHHHHDQQGRSPSSHFVPRRRVASP